MQEINLQVSEVKNDKTSLPLSLSIAKLKINYNRKSQHKSMKSMKNSHYTNLIGNSAF